MKSAFGVDHGEFAKAFAMPKMPKLPKFGGAGKHMAKPKMKKPGMAQGFASGLFGGGKSSAQNAFGVGARAGDKTRQAGQKGVKAIQDNPIKSAGVIGGGGLLTGGVYGANRNKQRGY